MPHEIPNLISVAEAQETAPVAVVSLTTREEMEAYIRGEYPAQAERIIKVIACESDFNPLAEGDNSRSFGLAQIHLPAHPDITKAQATDPRFALDWTIKEWKAGNENMWTCTRLTR